MQQLPNGVVEHFLKLEPRPRNAVGERGWALQNQGLVDLLQSVELGVLLGIQRLLKVGVGQILRRIMLV